MSDNDLIQRGDAIFAVEATAVMPHDDCWSRAVDAIAALPGVMPKVRPLVWVERNGVWYAGTIIGEYSVGFDDGWWCELSGPAHWDWEPSEDRRSYCGPSAAKAAAQADYEARILAALTTQPAPDAQVIREAAQDLVAFLDAKHQSYVAAKGRNPADYVSGYSIARDKANAILALLTPKGGA